MPLPKKLVLHVDGGCEPKNPGGSATSGWVFYDAECPSTPVAEKGEVVMKGGPLATNNYGEYCALRSALRHLVADGWSAGHLVVKADSKLLVEQVSNRWKCNKEHLRTVRDDIHKLFVLLNLHLCDTDDPVAPINMGSVELVWIPRDQNGYANDLCREAYRQSCKS